MPGILVPCPLRRTPLFGDRSVKHRFRISIGEKDLKTKKELEHYLFIFFSHWNCDKKIEYFSSSERNKMEFVYFLFFFRVS